MGLFNRSTIKVSKSSKAKVRKARAAKDPERQEGGRKAVKTNSLRDTRSENTAEAKRGKATKERAADRQFARADAKNDPQPVETPPSAVGIANTEGRKAAGEESKKMAADAEKARAAAKKEAMKPATEEQIAEIQARQAVAGY